MIKLKSKDIDLNSIFQYDLLKEILLYLSEYQNDINSQIRALRNNDKIQDMRLSRLEEKNNIIFNPSEFNINISNYESEKKEEEEKEKKIDDKKDEKKDGNKDVFDFESKDNSDDDTREKKEKKKKSTLKFDRLLNNNINNNTNNNNINNNNNTLNEASQIDQDLLKKIKKNIKENSEKINNLESKMNKQLEQQLKRSKDDLKRDFSSRLLEYKSKYKILDNRINELEQKNLEKDKVIEDLTVKCSDFDVFNAFKDSGDGTVDMSKVLVKALEEKVFKKFDLVDLKYKQESNEVIKIKKTLENIQPIIEKNERDINDIKEGVQKLNEDIDNLKELIELNDKKYKDIINEKENNIEQKLDNLKVNMEKMIKDNNDDLNYKINEYLKNEKISDEKVNNSNNLYDEETINTLEKKVTDLRKKTNDLENSFKLYMKNSDIEEIKKNIKDIKFEVEQKITKDSLKELYNLHLSDLDEINDLREHVSTIFDDLRKYMKSTTVLTSKVESIVGNINSLKDNNKSVPSKYIVDFSKYVENSKLSDVIKNMNKKFESIYNEIESLRRDLTDLKIDCNNYEKKERVNRLEDDVYKNFNEIKNSAQKNRNELFKAIKGLEVQIKSLGEEIKLKQDADTWILAKKPLQCFNCASCEAKIKNETPTEEYISWNKYPQQNEKTNRFGRGFSHMLQMMTYDFINNVDKNNNNSKEEYVPISEDHNLNSNNSNNIINEQNKNIKNSIDNDNKFSTQSKIAQIERSINYNINKFNKRETGKSSVPKNTGRLKLPKMNETYRKLKNEESTPYFDEEKNYSNINLNESFNSNEKKASFNSESPRIIKITKKRTKQILLNSYNKLPNNIIKNLKNLPDSNPKSRQQNIENNNNFQIKKFSQTIPIP